MGTAINWHGVTTRAHLSSLLLTLPGLAMTASTVGNVCVRACICPPRTAREGDHVPPDAETQPMVGLTDHNSRCRASLGVCTAIAMPG